MTEESASKTASDELTIDRSDFRRFAGHFVTGVSIVTTCDASGQPFGLTVNSVTSLSLDPPLYLICLSNDSNTLSALLESHIFAIHFLSAEQEAICRRFASKALDKFSLVAHAPGFCGAPVIEDVLAVCECRVQAVYPGGDHTIVVGTVKAMRVGSHVPLVFYKGELRGLA